ncbi:MAG TPA: hypothetical protein VJ901_00385 [Thermoanaerobaculia bacterium]|nr:hypothetical protein [Thermoanaerobaculia bacterium]
MHRVAIALLLIALASPLFAQQEVEITLLAIDTKTKKALWHSAPLVSNASNFTFAGGDAYLVTGYGFTAELDFVYILRAKDGAVVARIPVRSGPEHLLAARDRIYVRTYNRDYVFEAIQSGPRK